jgi:transketolase
LSDELERRGIDVIRGLAMDAPMAARSGHQGTAMALAPLAHVLWTRVLTYDAADPEWADGDRLILSAGHASILLYSMLHLTGQGLELEDLRQFRQWESKTPGHPEAGHTRGVEVTTGPLGQGLGNAVGMAIAERYLRARFGPELCDHHVFVIASDGDLSEGLSHEAASLAGHLGLGRLVVVYDDNRITIDGTTELALSDATAGRFAAYGWHVQEVGEAAEDLETLEKALLAGKAETQRPSLIVLRSRIAYPSAKHTDDPAAHGNPFDEAEIAATKQVMGLPPDQSFWVPDAVLALYREAGRRGAQARTEWTARLDALDTETRRAWDAAWSGVGEPGWRDALPSFEPGTKLATRKASQACLDALAPVVPGLIGGAADLTGNTGTALEGHGVQSRAEPGGRQIYFGVREHAMAASLVGMARHGGVVPFGGTFLVFSDYMRPSVRLAALSKAHCVFVWSHDSVGVGEDGPTHQPVEQVMSLRLIPGLQVLRPADATETAGCWRLALEHQGPTALILSRQDLPVLEATRTDGVAEGAYEVRPEDQPDLVLIGTGSEVAVCLEAADALAVDGVATRVVSMPSWERFAARSAPERAAVLPPGVPTVSVEAGTTIGWERWAQASVGIDRFGASAPGGVVLDRLGINADNVASTARRAMAEHDSPR